jgi:hypothetical protein
MFIKKYGFWRASIADRRSLEWFPFARPADSRQRCPSRHSRSVHHITETCAPERPDTHSAAGCGCGRSPDTPPGRSCRPRCRPRRAGWQEDTALATFGSGFAPPAERIVSGLKARLPDIDDTQTQKGHRKNAGAPFAFMCGGERGIRTLDGLLTHTPLAGERLRPLGHLSKTDRYRLTSGSGG